MNLIHIPTKDEKNHIMINSVEFLWNEDCKFSPFYHWKKKCRERTNVLAEIEHILRRYYSIFIFLSGIWLNFHSPSKIYGEVFIVNYIYKVGNYFQLVCSFTLDNNIQVQMCWAIMFHVAVKFQSQKEIIFTYKL